MAIDRVVLFFVCVVARIFSFDVSRLWDTVKRWTFDALLIPQQQFIQMVIGCLPWEWMVWICFFLMCHDSMDDAFTSANYIGVFLGQINARTKWFDKYIENVQRSVDRIDCERFRESFWIWMSKFVASSSIILRKMHQIEWVNQWICQRWKFSKSNIWCAF